MCGVYTRGMVASVAAGETEGCLVRASYIATQNMLTGLPVSCTSVYVKDPRDSSQIGALVGVWSQH